jgi:hypothetical protein
MRQRIRPAAIYRRSLAAAGANARPTAKCDPARDSIAAAQSGTTQKDIAEEQAACRQPAARVVPLNPEVDYMEEETQT